MSSILTARQISKSYTDGANVTPVLHQVSLDVKAGDMLAIVGSSGSGKSTLLHLLGGLLRPNSGFISIQNTNIANLSEKELDQFRGKYIGLVLSFETM